MYQWIGFVGENLNRKPMVFYHQIGWGFRFQLSHHPIPWRMVPPSDVNDGLQTPSEY